MDGERTPVKAKNFVVDGSKKDSPKKRSKEVVEKNMQVRGLKRTNAKDHSLWRFGCQNWLTPTRKENKPDFRGRRYLSTLLEQTDNDDDYFPILLLLIFLSSFL